MQSSSVHSCGFVFCTTIRLEVGLVPQEVGVGAGTVGGSGWSERGLCDPLGRLPYCQGVLVLPVILLRPRLGATASAGFEIRPPSSPTFDLCALGHLTYPLNLCFLIYKMGIAMPTSNFLVEVR